MELSWTTFVLEAINFLVLVWILHRLFYAPVKRTIEKRRAAVEVTLRKADSARSEAAELKTKYEDRLNQWEQEKKLDWEHLREEVAAERKKQMDQIAATVAMERESAEAQAEKSSASRRADEETQAIKQAMQFTAQLLRDLACPEIQQKILEQISTQWANLLPTQNFSTGQREVIPQVRSAFPLTDAQQGSILNAFKKQLGGGTSVKFEVDRELIAGFEIALGYRVIRANLRDELSYFVEAKNHEQY